MGGCIITRSAFIASEADAGTIGIDADTMAGVCFLAGGRCPQLPIVFRFAARLNCLLSPVLLVLSAGVAAAQERNADDVIAADDNAIRDVVVGIYRARNARRFDRLQVAGGVPDHLPKITLAAVRRPGLLSGSKRRGRRCPRSARSRRRS
jgi:hypothetical protein